jgi:predicted amidohydrolase YtcJ
MTDLILACGDIITMDPRRPAAAAVAITGATITAVGDRDDIRGWRGDRTQVIDLGGATLTPGLTDSHMHPALGLNQPPGQTCPAAPTWAHSAQRSGPPPRRQDRMSGNSAWAWTPTRSAPHRSGSR